MPLQTRNSLIVADMTMLTITSISEHNRYTGTLAAITLKRGSGVLT